MSDFSAGERLVRYIDVDQGLARVRNNKPLYKRMLNMFMDANEFSELEYHLNSRDYDEAAKSAHAIKGIAGNLSLPMLFETSNDLLLQLREGDVSENTLQLYLDTAERTHFAVKEALIKLDSGI